MIANDLPDEIWRIIFTILPEEDRHMVGLVCQRFQELVDSIMCKQDLPLFIHEGNVHEIRACVENNDFGKLDFRRVWLANIKISVPEIRFILQAIGNQIVDLETDGTNIFDILKINVMNIKSLKLYVDSVLEANVTHLDLSVFPFLEKLVLSSNSLLPNVSKILLEQINTPNMIALKELHLVCHEEIEDLVQSVLKIHADRLEIVNLWFMQTKLNWESALSETNSLRELYMYGEAEAVFKNISKSISLEYIELEWGTLSDSLFDFIIEKWSDSLTGIRLGSCEKLSHGSLIKLWKLHKLRNLKLRHFPFENSDLLEQRPLVGFLDLYNEDNLSETNLRSLLSRFPNLVDLNLYVDSTAMMNPTLATILRYHCRLRKLHICNCSRITEAGLIGCTDAPYSIRRLRLLEDLSLLSLEGLTDRALIEGFHFPNLRTLDLARSHKITSKGIEKLLINCPRLEKLTISSDTLKDDKTPFAFVHGLKNCLKHVIFKYPDVFPDFDPEHIRDVFDNLTDPITNKRLYSPAQCRLQFY